MLLSNSLSLVVLCLRFLFSLLFFFFNDTATTEIYTLSLHDALPIFPPAAGPTRKPGPPHKAGPRPSWSRARRRSAGDRKSTRLNSSHGYISYAVFCLKKKKTHVPSFPSRAMTDWPR